MFAPDLFWSFQCFQCVKQILIVNKAKQAYNIDKRMETLKYSGVIKHFNMILGSVMYIIYTLTAVCVMKRPPSLCYMCALF